MDVQKGDNQNTDRIIRHKMNRLKPEFQPGSWDQLSERLDEAEAADAFDAEIGSRLQRMHVPYKKNSWAALAARLELERRRIQAVVHYKAMEVSLLLLLFLTAWQHLPQQPQKPTLPPGIPIANIDISNDSDNNNATPEITDIVGGDNILSEGEQPSAITDKTSSAGDLAAVDLERQPKGSGTHIALNNWMGDHSRADKPVSMLNTNLGEGIAFDQQNAQMQLKTFMAQKAERLSSPSDIFETAGPLAALEGSAPSLLDYGDPGELLEFIRPVEQKTYVRIGFVGSPDYNRVVTPSQEVDDGTVAPSLDRYSLGYGGGITIGIEHGRWELETGALYAARRYQAIPAVYVSGNLREGYSGIGLTNFELNTVSAPLNLRYNFILHDKWRIYAQGGASLNLVLGANYYLEDQAEAAGIPQNDPGGNGSGTSALEKPAPLRDKTLTAGWFEGGPFWDNATIYGDFGLGLERYMNANMSLFVQPTYRHALPLFNEGLGPYQDRIHNFGIGMGLKVRL